jgi:GntR family transcriptional repressor for pyruvate dehydrogenase complex
LKIKQPLGPQKSLGEQVTDEIQRLMLTGKLKEGEKLPSERELCELFGVSRTVIREAIRILQTKGLVEVRPGIGSIARSPSSNQVIEGLSLLIQTKANGAEVSLIDLYEARLVLEIEITKLAVKRATLEDIQGMQRVIHELETLVRLPAQFYERAVDFHRVLALAAHNSLLLIVFDAIQELVVGMRQELVPEPIAPEEALSAFTQIAEHVQERDSRLAVEAVRQHLHEINQRLEAALGEVDDTGNSATRFLVDT